MKEPLTFDQILYNEPIHWLEQRWGRRLNEHERNLAILLYRYIRTNLEVEELKILDTLGCNCGRKKD